MQLPAENRGPITEASKVLGVFHSAIEQQTLYVPLRFAIEYRRLGGVFVEFADAVQWERGEPLPAGNDRVTAILTEAGRLQDEIRRMHTRLPDELADSIMENRAQPAAQV